MKEAVERVMRRLGGQERGKYGAWYAALARHRQHVVEAIVTKAGGGGVYSE